MITISKSSYIRGLQCEKSFYLNFFHKQFGITRDEQETKKFEIGHDVGKYAQQLFPGGVDCGYEITRDRTKSAELTRKAIKEGKKVIYEAAFEYDGLLCFIDILVKKGNEWIIYEVKSSTSVKDYHYNDAAFQYYVISNNIPVKDAFVVCLNNKYVRNGDIDIKQLFIMESVLERALDLQDEIKTNVIEYKKLTVAKAIPDIKLGKHCDDPFACDFKGYCWKDVPEYSVFNIQNMRGKQFELYNMGIVELKDIPKDFKLNDKQLMEVRCYLNQTEYIDKDAIKDFLTNISYPLYFLDFETFQLAIPEFDNSRSYQQIPFQFSLYYKKTKDSEAVPYAFLAEPAGDPRKAFAESLIKMTEKPGLIVVYNAGFEKSRINEIARDFPEYAKQLNNINERIIDLMVPFSQKSFYKPAMRGSYSMKNVLPAINSKYSYENLNVQEGSQASNEFLRMRSINDHKEIEQIRKNLIDYCNQDTFGMILILEELEKIEISNRIMTEKEKREINNQFIGYGDPESPVWIMGYEEGGEYNQEEFTDLNYFRKKDIIFRYNNSLIVPQKDENNIIIPDKYREPEPNSTYGGYKFMLEKLFPSLLSDGRFFIMNLWPYSKPFHQTNNNLPEYAREFLKFPLDWSYNQILANIREDRFNYLRNFFRTFNWKEKFIFFCVGHGLPNKDLESFLKSLYLVDCIPYSLDENVGKVLVDDYKMKFIGPHASTYGYYKNNDEVITIISELIRSNNYYVSLNM